MSPSIALLYIGNILRGFCYRGCDFKMRLVHFRIFQKISCPPNKSCDKINLVDRKSLSLYGALAQLGERYTGSVEVSGSSPLCSIDKTPLADARGVSTCLDTYQNKTMNREIRPHDSIISKGFFAYLIE